jgi:hypothetical protein
MANNWREVTLCLEKDFYEGLDKLREKARAKHSQIPESMTDFMRIILTLGSKTLREELDMESAATNLVIPANMQQMAKLVEKVK